MLRKSDAEDVVSGIYHTLNLHDALIIGRVINEDDRLFLVARNWKPEIIFKLTHTNIF
jgi:hypothetical protein